MNKRKLIACAVVAVAFIGGSLAYYQHSITKSELSSLAMANIEALTRSENPNVADGHVLTDCYKNSSIDPSVQIKTGTKCVRAEWYQQCKRVFHNNR